MSTDEQAVERLVRLLEGAGIPYMLTGSLASSHHGLPRATNDADVVIDPNRASLDVLLTALRRAGFYVDERVARDALERHRQFNVIDPETAFKVDLIIRKDRPFSGEEFSRREPREFGGRRVAMATAEDVILSKLEWAKRAGGSMRQMEDAAGVLRISGRRLDRGYIERWAAELGVADLWHALLAAEGEPR